MEAVTTHIHALKGVFLASLLLSASLQAEVTVFSGATLIDGNGNAPAQNSTLVVKDGRIVAIGESESAPFRSQTDVKLVDLTGKTIIPGLISNHSHLGVVKDGKISPD